MMDVVDAVRTRRALRIISDSLIDSEAVQSMMEAARLAPSCFNNQPWRFVFVQDEHALTSVKDALPSGNIWATRAPLIIVVAAKRDDDCRLSDSRDYFLFDCGLSVSQLILRAVELGLVAHPIAGYEPQALKEVLGIPEEYVVITLIICAHHGDDDSLLSDTQKEVETERPERDPVGENFFLNAWGNPFTE
jgi:nitroreductase